MRLQNRVTVTSNVVLLYFFPFLYSCPGWSFCNLKNAIEKHLLSLLVCRWCKNFSKTSSGNDRDSIHLRKMGSRIQEALGLRVSTKKTHTEISGKTCRDSHVYAEILKEMN